MKTQLIALSIAILTLVGLMLSADAQQKDKDKGKGQQKEQGQGKGNQGKGQDKKVSNGNNDNRGQGNNNNQGNANNGNNGKGKNEDKGNNGKNGSNGNNGSSNKSDDVVNFGKDGFRWNPETFKDRDKVRKADKVTICHKLNKDNDPGVTIKVSSNALQAHMNHGDVQGECPNATGNRFSNDFLDRRNDYYNALQNNQEQVVYSRSILDYARERLTQSRLQLSNNNLPPADLEKRRVAVVELEQNVSLLEALLVEAGRYTANKLF
jgi:hypothetical protein